VKPARRSRPARRHRAAQRPRAASATHRPRAAFYAHPLALVESSEVGPGTRVWAWAHVMSGARVGSDCNIGEHCFIESGARLGDRVTVKNGVAVWNGVVAEDDVFLGPNAVLTNDLRPRSKLYRDSVQPTVLKRGASVGANATLLCGITVGPHAMIGAGAVVTRDVPPHALVVGNPARIAGRVCRCGAPLAPRSSSTECPECAAR
jgi:UDP-2-acetamido-3-amino-2,3-dideoxy-glucuronate N-acetyltransferase